MPQFTTVIVYEAIGKGDTNTAVEDFFGIPADQQNPYFPRPKYFLPDNTTHDVTVETEDFQVVLTSQDFWFPRKPFFESTTDLADDVIVPDTEGLADIFPERPILRKPYYLPTETYDLTTSTEDFFGIPSADAQGSYWFPRTPFFLSTNVDHDTEINQDSIPSADAQGAYFFPRKPYYLPANTEHDVFTEVEDFFVQIWPVDHYFPRPRYFLPDNTEHDVTTASEDFQVALLSPGWFFPRPAWFLSPDAFVDEVTVAADTEGLADFTIFPPYSSPWYGQFGTVITLTAEGDDAAGRKQRLLLMGVGT